MSYCTQSDLTTRFGAEELIQLTDRAATGVADAAVIAGAIADADAAINGYLAGRYTLPLASVPSNLTRIACDLTRYYLYENAATQIVIDRYDAAVKYLELVAKGAIGLGPGVGGATQEASSGMAALVSEKPVMSAAATVY